MKYLKDFSGFFYLPANFKFLFTGDLSALKGACSLFTSQRFCITIGSCSLTLIERIYHVSIHCVSLLDLLVMYVILNDKFPLMIDLHATN